MDETGQHPAGMDGQSGAQPPGVAPERLARVHRLARAPDPLHEDTGCVDRAQPAAPDAPASAEAGPELDELTALEQRMDALCQRAAAREDGAMPLRQSAPLKALASVLAAELGQPRRPPPPDEAARPAPAPEAPASTGPPPEVPSPTAEAPAPTVPPPEVPPPTAEAEAPTVPPPEMPPPIALAAPADGPMANDSVPPVHPPRAAPDHVTGIAIVLWSVAVLLLGALVVDRSVAPGPEADRPGRHPATQTTAAPADAGKGSGHDLGRTIGGAVGIGSPAATQASPPGTAGAARVSASERENLVRKAAATAAATSATATSRRVAAARARAGTMRPGGAAVSPIGPRSAPAPRTAPAPAPAVVVRAIADTWIAAYEPTGARVFSRLLHAGESWTPPRPDLLLTTGNGGGTELVVNGVAGPPLGKSGSVLRMIPLDPAQSSAPEQKTDAVGDLRGRHHGDRPALSHRAGRQGRVVRRHLRWQDHAAR